MFGVGLAFVADFLDNTVKSPEDLEQTDRPALAGDHPSLLAQRNRRKAGTMPIPTATGPRTAPRRRGGGRAGQVSEVELINHLFPKISIAEDYRTVRTAILFSRSSPSTGSSPSPARRPRRGNRRRSPTSPSPSPSSGERVLTIDADLRKPRLHKIFKVRNRAGLSDVLTGRAGWTTRSRKRQWTISASCRAGRIRRIRPSC